MVRRIGFGEGSSDRTNPVRRRGEAPRPEPEQKTARQTAPRPAGASKPAPRSPVPPRAQQSAARSSNADDDASAKESGDVSIGKLVILGFLWTILINWALASYGGLQNAIFHFQALAEGEAEPIRTLFPAIMPLAIGLFVTQLILGRRRKR